MEWFLLEKPTLCLRAMLNHEASTCGINIQKGPSLHYSGHFWAASCDHINTLPPLIKLGGRKGDFLDYIAAELCIGESMQFNSTMPDLGYSLFNSTRHVISFSFGTIACPGCMLVSMRIGTILC